MRRLDNRAAKSFSILLHCDDTGRDYPIHFDGTTIHFGKVDGDQVKPWEQYEFESAVGVEDLIKGLRDAWDKFTYEYASHIETVVAAVKAMNKAA